jgi:LysM repeat protein
MIPPAIARLLAPAALLALVSCQSTKNTASADPYATNYGADGGYNPYPGQTGYVAPGGSTYQAPAYPQTPTYTQAPSQSYSTPPPSDPYAFSAPKTSPSSSSGSTKKKTSSSSAKKSTSTKKKSSSGSRYTVQKGDTLYGIARKKGSTVSRIKSANGLSSDVIRPGQSLKIP